MEQTKGHVNRLEEIFKKLEEKPTGKKCKAMEGLIKEGAETIGEDASDAAKDVMLIAAAQRVEHYEIAGYGSVKTYAQTCSASEDASSLSETLQEEKDTDEKLTEAAETINAEADEEGEKEEKERKSELPSPPFELRFSGRRKLADVQFVRRRSRQKGQTFAYALLCA